MDVLSQPTGLEKKLAKLLTKFGRQVVWDCLQIVQSPELSAKVGIDGNWTKKLLTLLTRKEQESNIWYVLHICDGV